ncbi:MAG: Serine/threonine protein kinase [Pseudonocardiales bacterium]|nr:Serine/threonine protein kinase [Pseudonocardiales bacterium]
MGGRAGWKVSGYVAEVLLGYGGSGQVWSGRSVRSGQPVALKRIDASDPARRRSAQAEAALLSALEHPHLVRLHELVPDGDALVLVLDLADGGSLADILARRHHLEPGEVVTALSPIDAALAYAHDEGVTHGDVSAANVLFTGDGVPLLADLGTARLLGDNSLAHATLTYLDPSVAAGGAPTPPSDVFALAAVALHALCGSPPWSGRSAAEVIAEAASGEIAELEHRLGGLPPAVATVVRRGLAREPYARGSAAEFALDLRQAAQPVPVELSAGRGALLQPASEVDGSAPVVDASAPVVDLPVPVVENSASAVDASTGRHQHSIVVASPAPAAGAPRIGADKHPGGLDRPGFSRPRLASAVAPAGFSGGVWSPVVNEADESPDWAALPMTHAVRARVRPPLPTPGRGQRWLGPIRQRLLDPNMRRLAGVSMILIALAVGFVAWRALGPANRSVAQSSDRRLAPSDQTPSDQTPSDQEPSDGGPSDRAPLIPGDDEWAKVLVTLDAQRERAYATNDPALLAGVYAPGSLLDQDTATMTRSVPAGCRVVGLRTTYAGVVALAQTDTGATIRATATLAPAAVTCANTVSTHTPARTATELTIELVTAEGGYRIAGLRLE